MATYSVGDYVRVKDYKWYTDNRDSNGFIILPNKPWAAGFTPNMVQYCGKVFKISDIFDNVRYLFEGNAYYWDDWMFDPVEICGNETFKTIQRAYDSYPQGISSQMETALKAPMRWFVCSPDDYPLFSKVLSKRKFVRPRKKRILDVIKNIKGE